MRTRLRCSSLIIKRFGSRSARYCSSFRDLRCTDASRPDQLTLPVARSCIAETTFNCPVSPDGIRHDLAPLLDVLRRQFGVGDTNHARPICPKLALPANDRYQIRKYASPFERFSRPASSAFGLQRRGRTPESVVLSGAFVRSLAIQPLHVKRPERLVLAQFDETFAGKFQRCAKARCRDSRAEDG